MKTYAFKLMLTLRRTYTIWLGQQILKGNLPCPASLIGEGQWKWVKPSYIK